MDGTKHKMMDGSDSKGSSVFLTKVYKSFDIFLKGKFCNIVDNSPFAGICGKVKPVHKVHTSKLGTSYEWTFNFTREQ